MNANNQCQLSKDNFDKPPLKYEKQKNILIRLESTYYRFMRILFNLFACLFVFICLCHSQSAQAACAAYGSALPTVGYDAAGAALKACDGSNWVTVSSGGGGGVTAAYDAGASTSINWSNGYIQYTSASCGSFTFTNMTSGGIYTLVVQGTTSGTCAFTHSGLTFRLPQGHTSTDSGTQTLYNFIVAGTNVYTFWRRGV